MPTQLRRAAFAAVLLVPMFAIAQETAPPPAAAAATAAPAAPVPAADAAAANTGTIVFFREKKFAGAAVRYKVREGEVELGKLSSGTYFTVHAPAGKHEYTVHSEAKDVLTIEVEPGETYYVIGGVTMGVLAGHPNLSPSDQATYEKLKAGLKDVTGQDVGGDK